MSNRIKDIWVHHGRLDPAEAELGIEVYPEVLTSTTQVRGRLMGPRCRYSSTVEVAYPLRECSRQYEKEGQPHILLRVIIPEASFWDPESPFLYEGPVELWQKGQLCDQRQLIIGLKSLNLDRTGLRWNGQLVPLRGVKRSTCEEAELLQLHRDGVNLLYASPRSVPASELTLADLLGFFVLFRISEKRELSNETAIRGHPSFLGGVLTARMLQDPMIRTVGLTTCSHDSRIWGVELSGKLRDSLPERTQFIVCKEEELSDWMEIDLPKLILKEMSFQERTDLRESQPSAGHLGSIYS